MPQVTFPFETPDQVAILGDWHGTQNWALQVLAALDDHGVKVFVHLGDFGLFSDPGTKRYLNGIEEKLEENDAWLVWICGNHEDHDRIDSWTIDEETGLHAVRPRILYLPRGSRWTWHERDWLALGGATSVDKNWRFPGKDWWPQEGITQAQAQVVIDEGPADIMITHDCPEGVDVPNIPPDSTWPLDAMVTARSHRHLLREVVEVVQPDLLFHGHFHSRYDTMLKLTSDKLVHIVGLSQEYREGNIFVMQTLTDE